jgi:hypothetical protein
MRIPPDVMDNQFNALAAFVVPKSYIDRKLMMFVLLKDETKATAHSMPDEVAGSTDFLGQYITKSLL